MQICAISFEHTKNLTFASVGFHPQEAVGGHRKLLSSEPSHTGMHNVPHLHPHPHHQHLPTVFIHRIYLEPRVALQPSFWFPPFPTPSDYPPVTTSQWLTSFNPSDAYIHKQIQVFIAGKCHIYCSIYVVLNHLTSIKPCSYIY